MLHNVKNIIKNAYEHHIYTHRYFDDMHVDFNLAQETASKIKNTEQYITNQLVHDGLRYSNDVLNTLFKLSKREIN
jgi:CRISPR/Cas system-associated protein Cas7 (RAMP superfamily)